MSFNIKGITDVLTDASKAFGVILGVLVSIDKLVQGNLQVLASTFAGLLGAELRALKVAIFGMIPVLPVLSELPLNLAKELIQYAELGQRLAGLPLTAQRLLARDLLAKKIKDAFKDESIDLDGMFEFADEQVVKADLAGDPTQLGLGGDGSAPRNIASGVLNLESINGVVSQIANSIGMSVADITKEAASTFSIGETVDEVKGIVTDASARNALADVKSGGIVNQALAVKHHGARKERVEKQRKVEQARYRAPSAARIEAKIKQLGYDPRKGLGFPSQNAFLREIQRKKDAEKEV